MLNFDLMFIDVECLGQVDRKKNYNYDLLISFNRRGIPAAPILNGYCGPYEVGMKQSMVNEPIFNYLY